jgi:hypothetical protein
LAQAVVIVGAGNVERSFVLYTIILLQEPRLLRPRKITVTAVRRKMDFLGNYIAEEDITVIVLRDGKMRISNGKN